MFGVRRGRVMTHPFVPLIAWYSPARYAEYAERIFMMSTTFLTSSMLPIYLRAWLMKKTLASLHHCPNRFLWQLTITGSRTACRPEPKPSVG
jgi:hypothetical protein